MMKNTATVRTRAWYGDEELTLNFPTGWEVEVLGPKDAPAKVRRVLLLSWMT
jgi:hypothetical protein